MLKEFILYISSLSIRRLVNYTLCYLGFSISRIFRFPFVLGLPFSISVEPTTRCNLACPDCVTGAGLLKRKKGDQSIENFKKIVDEVFPYTFSILTHFQGEPLLNRDVFTMIRYSTSKRMVTEMATNGTLISNEVADEMVQSGLKKVVITIDSPHETDFGFYRKGADYNEVVAGIKRITSAKKKFKSKYPLLVIELLLFKKNSDQIEKFAEFAKDLKADIIRIKTAQILDLSNAETKIPESKRFSRYLKTASGNFMLKGSSSKPCSAPWTKLSITHDGWIVPCCFDSSGYYIMGFSKFSTLPQMWFSRHYNLFRNRLLNNRSSMNICSTCPSGRMKLDFNID